MAGWMVQRTGTSPEHGAVARLAQRHDAAVEHYRDGRPATALPLLEQIVFGCRAVLGEHHPDTLTAEGNLAVVYLSLIHI